MKTIYHYFLTVIKPLVLTNQFDFLSKRTSCNQLLNCFRTWLVSFFTNKYINVINTDIQKVFDSVSHLKLIKTLSQYKISRNLVKWLKEFLQDRTQRVVIGNMFSESLLIFSGVPQEVPTFIYNLHK